MKKEVRSMQDAKLKQKARETLLKGQKKQTPVAIQEEGKGDDESTVNEEANRYV
jgi:hypothetical protein